MIGISIANSLGFTGPSVLPDASSQAYFAATGITGATQQAAINNLVKGLKADGIWSKMKAVYPFVTDNRNLLSYTDTFSNSYWQASSGGLKTPNYATAPDGTMTACRVYNGGYFQSQGISKSVGTYVFSFYVKMTSGTSGSIRVFLDGGTSTTTVNVTNTWTRVEIAKTFASTDVGTCGFFIDSDVLIWHPQLELGSTATTYQPIATTQQAYIASQFKYNLVNPVDSDAAFRLVFNGGWTHSSNGAQGNGTNGWADTKLQTNTNLSETSTTLSIYSRTNNTQLTHDIGARNFGYENPLGILSNYNTVTYNVWGDYLSTTTGVNTSAYFIQTKNSTTAKLFRNTTNILTATKTLSALPTTNVIIGAAQDSSPGVYVAFSNRQYAFAHIGDGLLDAEASALYNHVQNFQLALNRAV